MSGLLSPAFQCTCPSLMYASITREEIVNQEKARDGTTSGHADASTITQATDECNKMKVVQELAPIPPPATDEKLRDEGIQSVVLI